ncbi:hypothetical protein HKCCE3408_13060 [Rhodobacterales bacterium HKCCE3408]|nr:hypothetical protein [Rhodobacterales bacterium HKCCE3408]
MTRWLLALCLLAGPLSAQGLPGPQPFLTLRAGTAEAAFGPTDFLAVDHSEMAGITDIFLRFLPEAAERVDAMARPGVTIEICGRPVAHDEPIAGGGIYLPNRLATEAEAIRALWHGRIECDALDPELFHGA